LRHLSMRIPTSLKDPQFELVRAVLVHTHFLMPRASTYVLLTMKHSVLRISGFIPLGYYRPVIQQLGSATKERCVSLTFSISAVGIVRNVSCGMSADESSFLPHDEHVRLSFPVFF
jgi:hypothetical protein